MKLSNTVKQTGALAAGVLLSLFSTNSFAVGTASNTSIANSAIVGYSVGGTAQNTICSSPTGNSTTTGGTSASLAQCAANGGTGATAGTATAFLVDDKLVLLVQTIDAADVNVTPGQTGAVLTYKVTNNGNATQGVSFSFANEASTTAATTAGAGFTGTDDFDATSVQIFVHKDTVGGGYTTGTYSSANDTQSAIGQIAPGQSVSVYIVASIPAAQLDTDVAVLGLIATVDTAGGAATYNTAPGATSVDQSGSAWTPGTVQNIFADTVAGTDDIALDGKSSSRDVYLVKSAKLTIAKTSSVVSDPTGDAIPHAIPGAVIKYTITVNNTGTTAATGITLADSIATQTANVTYQAGSIKLTDPNVNSGAQLSCADAGSSGGSFGSDTCSFTSGTNTVNAFVNSLTNGQTATVTFQVTIN